jgi:membrane protein implicated in regulation of membrane protease activity
MIGQMAVVKDGLQPGEKGYVMHRGELWQALSDEALPAEAKVYIHGIDGIVLRVSAAPPSTIAEMGPVRRRLASLLRRKAA